MEEARHAYLRSDDGIHALILDRHVGGQAAEHVDPIQVLALELLPHSLVRLDGEDAITLFPAREELGELAGAGAQVHEQRSFEPGDADFGEQGVDGFVREGGTVLVVEVCSQEAVARFRGQGGRHCDGWTDALWMGSVFVGVQRYRDTIGPPRDWCLRPKPYQVITVTCRGRG